MVKLQKSRNLTKINILKEIKNVLSFIVLWHEVVRL